MKEIFLQHAQYDHWANTRLFNLIASLPAEDQNATVVSSFSSLRLTLLHMYKADLAWWQRVQLIEKQAVIDENITVEQISKEIATLSQHWIEWLQKSSEADLKQELVYKNWRQEQFIQPISEILLHVFNHQTYHRGQVVTLLNQLKIQQIPATDFIVWSRSDKT